MLLFFTHSALYKLTGWKSLLLVQCFTSLSSNKVLQQGKMTLTTSILILSSFGLFCLFNNSLYHFFLKYKELEERVGSKF